MKTNKECKFRQDEIISFKEVIDNEIQIISQEDYEKKNNKAISSYNKFLEAEEWRKHIIWKCNRKEEYAINVEPEKYKIKHVTIYSNSLDSIVHCQSNLDALFKYHPLLNTFMFDEFSHDNYFNGEEYDEDKKPAEIFNFFKRNFGEWCPRIDIKEAIQECLNNNTHNLVTEYFDNLVWDGEERLETFLIEYYNAEDTKINRVYFKRWMIALVKRCYEPGCKFDNMLVLQGEQGKKKSSLFEWLGTINGKKYCNHLPSDLKDIKNLVYTTKDSFIMMNDDFDDICDKGNIGIIKEFITKVNDRTDLKYQHARNFPRHYVLCATTNSDTFLSDDKTFDERRFWIVRVNPDKSEFDLDDELKRQLFAEAIHIYKNNPNIKLWINEPELIEEEKNLQKIYKNAYNDPLLEKIYNIFTTKYYLPNKKFLNENQFSNAINGLEYEESIVGKIDKNPEDYHYINIIPVSWVSNIVAAGRRSGDRIIQILNSQGFKVEKMTRYKYNNGAQLTCIHIINQPI